MFATLLLGYLLNAMDRQIFSVLAPEVRGSLGLSVQEVGLASTIFTLGMGLAGVPIAFLASRFSRRALVTVGLAAFSVTTAATALATNYPSLLLYRFLSGIGEAMQFTTTLAIGTTYYHRNKAFVASCLTFVFGIGTFLGPNLAAHILAAGDWRSPFLAFGLAGLPATLLTAAVVRPWFSEVPSAMPPPEREAGGGEPSIVQATLVAIATVFVGLSIYGYLGLYATYLREGLAFRPADAALAFGCYGAGGMASLCCGWLGDRVDFRNVLLVSLTVATAAGWAMFHWAGASLPLHMGLSFLLGMSLGGVSYANLSTGLIWSLGGRDTARATGIFVTALYVPAAFAGYLLGWLREAYGWASAGSIQTSGCAAVALAACILATIHHALRRKRYVDVADSMVEGGRSRP